MADSGVPTRRLLATAYSGPLLLAVALAFATVVHGLNPRVGVRGFLLLSSLESALPLLALAGHLLSLSACGLGLTRRLIGGDRLSRLLVPSLLYHAALLALFVNAQFGGGALRLLLRAI